MSGWSWPWSNGEVTLKEEVEQPETDDEKVRRRLQQRREQSKPSHAKEMSW